MGTGDKPFVKLEEVIARQLPTPDGWICPDCKRYGTGVNCKEGYFISAVGVNMKGCPSFKEKLIILSKARREWKKNIQDGTI